MIDYVSDIIYVKNGLSMSKTIKNKGGRPRVDATPVTVRMPPELLTALEAFRRDQRLIPTRPEAIREIVGDWLAGKGYLPEQTPAEKSQSH